MFTYFLQVVLGYKRAARWLVRCVARRHARARARRRSGFELDTASSLIPGRCVGATGRCVDDGAAVVTGVMLATWTGRRRAAPIVVGCERRIAVAQKSTLTGPAFWCDRLPRDRVGRRASPRRRLRRSHAPVRAGCERDDGRSEHRVGPAGALWTIVDRCCFFPHQHTATARWFAENGSDQSRLSP